MRLPLCFNRKINKFVWEYRTILSSDFHYTTQNVSYYDLLISLLSIGAFKYSQFPHRIYKFIHGETALDTIYIFRKKRPMQDPAKYRGEGRGVILEITRLALQQKFMLFPDFSRTVYTIFGGTSED